MTGCDENLRVIAGARQFLGTREQRSLQRLGFFDGGAKRSRSQLMEAARRSVHDHQAELGKHRSQEFAESLSERSSLLRCVTLAEKISGRAPADQFTRAFQSGFEPGTARFAAAVDAKSTDRKRPRGFELELQRLDRGLRRQSDLVNFGEIVVFAGEPEDRHVSAPGLSRRVLGLANRGCGLQQCEQRAPEERNLLACYNGCGAVAKLLDVLAHGLRRTEVFGLVEKQRCEALAVICGEFRNVSRPAESEGL